MKHTSEPVPETHPRVPEFELFHWNPKSSAPSALTAAGIGNPQVLPLTRFTSAKFPLSRRLRRRQPHLLCFHDKPLHAPEVSGKSGRASWSNAGHRENFFLVGISYSLWIYLCPAQTVQSRKDGAAALEPAHPAAFWGAELGSLSLHKLRGKNIFSSLGYFPL